MYDKEKREKRKQELKEIEKFLLTRKILSLSEIRNMTPTQLTDLIDYIKKELNTWNETLDRISKTRADLISYVIPKPF